MDKNQERKRLNKLFKELEQIAASPSRETDDVRKKLDDLRIRTLELKEETQNHPEVDSERSDDVHPNRHIHLPVSFMRKVLGLYFPMARWRS
jgi:hypothetical protein